MPFLLLKRLIPVSYTHLQLLARLRRAGEQVESKPAGRNTALTLNLLGDGAQFVVVATQQDNAGE